LAYHIERKFITGGRVLGALFIVSAAPGAGKTALIAGLAVNFINSGHKVGYLKSAGDPSPAFMEKIPGLDVIGKPGLKGYDVVLAEGRLGSDADDAAVQAAYATAKEMKARVIAVEVYPGGGPRCNDIYRGFGGDFLGVVINKAPASQLKRTRTETEARLGAAGLRLLGVIPESRVLMAITVGELAAALGGKILNNAEKADDLVENYMLGALIVDSGLDYFGRKSRKAAVLRQERSDMQLAALETSTACLVLGGDTSKPPMSNVMYKAETRGVPVIAAGAPVSDIVARIEDAILNTRLDQLKKLAALAETVGRNLDVKALV
jgi:BioD-like phosphotransacetylase family protein